MQQLCTLDISAKRPGVVILLCKLVWSGSSPTTACSACCVQLKLPWLLGQRLCIYFAINHCEGQLQFGSVCVASRGVCTAAAIDINAPHICSHNFQVTASWTADPRTSVLCASAVLKGRTAPIVHKAGDEGRSILQRRMSRPSVLVRRVGNAQVRLMTRKLLLQH